MCTNNSKVYIKYALSKDQERVSNEVLKNYINKENTLIYAVCGAGKTELVFKVIEYALKRNKKVGFAIPRRDVVIELKDRIERSFPNNKVVAVYGGNHQIIEGDIVCLTTHQLYRYDAYFDLLILDEIDAFPYHGNPILHSIFKRSVKGNYVLMSATPDDSILKEFSKKGHKIVNLFTRYHNHPIPLPKIKVAPFMIKYFYLIYKLRFYSKKKLPCIVFVPTIEIAENLYKIIKIFAKKGHFVHSKCENRQETITKFRNHEYDYLISTAVLERGVTLKNLQVIIFNSDHSIYNRASLIQISGRVGRVIGAEDGEVIYVCDKKTKYMEEAIEFTRRANSFL